MKIFIEITRVQSNHIDFYRFESNDEVFGFYDRAVEFLRRQVIGGTVKEWVMKTVNTLPITKYDLIED